MRIYRKKEKRRDCLSNWKRKRIPAMYGISKNCRCLCSLTHREVLGQTITGSTPIGTWTLMKVINRKRAFASRDFVPSSRYDIIIFQKNGHRTPQARLPVPPRKHHPLQQALCSAWSSLLRLYNSSQLPVPHLDQLRACLLGRGLCDTCCPWPPAPYSSSLSLVKTGRDFGPGKHILRLSCFHNT